MNPRHRLTAVLAFCGVFAAAIVVRSAFIQLKPDSRFSQLARKQFRSKVLIRPRRGLILDRNGEPLAINSDIESLAIDPSRFKDARKDRSSVARRLAQAFRISDKKILAKMQENREFAWVKRHLTSAEIASLRTSRILDTSGSMVDGLWLVKEAKRVYPHGELAAHVLGSVNLDSEGLEGLELSLNERLEGKVVSIAAVKDALGRPAFLDAEAAKDVRDGESVRLTIDAPLQFTVEQELKEGVRTTGAKGGSIIVLDAENGQILAMANEPSFNPNHSGVRPERRRNRAVTDAYEPGSTLKPLLVAAALKNGWKITDRLYGEKGEMKVQGHVISEAEAHERFESISLAQMVQKSSNIVAAKLAMKLGAEKLRAGYSDFGIGTRTQIDFPGEIPGKVGDSSTWQPIHLATLGYGHGLLSTPLQIARAYAVLASGGKSVQPHLLTDRALAPSTQIWPEAVVKRVTESLLLVTQEGGTGTRAAVEGLPVAGKTGTSLVVDPKTGKYAKGRYVNTFVGFAPGAERAIVALVVLEEPKGGYAGATAAPIFASVYKAAAARLGIWKGEEKELILTQSRSPDADLPRKKPVISDRLRSSLAKVGAASATSQEQVSRSLQWVDRGEAGDSHWMLPSFEGLTVREALRSLEGRDFEVELQGLGFVVRNQVPAPGSVVREGSPIRLTLGEP